MPRAISPTQFVAALAEYAPTPQIEVSLRVSLAGMTISGKDVTDHIASPAWKATGYRFSFNYSRVSNDDLTRFNYLCCQARGTANDMDKATTVSKENQRTVRRMDRFECHGKLHVTPHEGVANVEITHQRSHKSYVDIKIPVKWRTFINENHGMGPAKLWQEILCQCKGDGTAFTQKSVRYAWASIESEQWLHDKDPIQSARVYLEKDGAEEKITLLEMPEIEGARTLAFIVNDFVQKWAQYTDTFLVDSTFDTNGNHMELFAGVADVLGEGLPLSYLFVTTEATAIPRTEQAVLVVWMEAIRSLGVDPEFVQSDKVQSEIMP